MQPSVKYESALIISRALYRFSNDGNSLGKKPAKKLPITLLRSKKDDEVIPNLFLIGKHETGNKRKLSAHYTSQSKAIDYLCHIENCVWW